MTRTTFSYTLKIQVKPHLMQVSQRKHCNSSDKESALSTLMKLFVKTNFQSRVSANKSTFQNTETNNDLSQINKPRTTQKLNEATHETWFTQ
ncbi:hypothetical protein MX824_004871 [Vibrio parahaemolyticus]|nr:hypothetical protein [Vibrio parahaemolyticus]EJC6785039.1 hypothetical protein [Vibrio parahaemolyticus]EJC6813343.1 hypothetical protein [Vibrio parahaemolyticus]EJC6928027.1 hypothetical protein [Vibrio parahaemolyticus]EJC6942367.1 hypothetical protein [Vibrio parahaemolyticus]